MKRFNCVVEYESGNRGLVETLRYENIFPSHGVIKIYHPVDHVDIYVNGKLAADRPIKLFLGSRVEIEVGSNRFHLLLRSDLLVYWKWLSVPKILQ